MTDPAPRVPATDLRALAREAMRDRGLEAEFPPAAAAEAAAAVPASEGGLADLRELPWCSIDNDDSRDLDQLSVAWPRDGGAAQLLVAVADVDAVVAKGSAVDRHAARNTTSVYTAGGIFPMLPERLSTSVTSLNPDQDRVALVVRLELAADGSVTDAGLERATVRNHAKLAYGSVSAWLDGAAAPPALAGREPVADSIRLQDRLAERLWDLRQRSGALELDTGETRAVVRDGQVVDLVAERLTRGQRLIAEAMIASNGVVARFLSGRGLPAIRRVVREPRRWDRIVALARLHGGQLPSAPDAPALEAFLHQRRAADPEGFTDLSLAVVKLIGRGEYALERSGDASGHFGLAVRDYVHSTAPNRRFPDLIAQRAVKAALAGRPQPYGESELSALATHCTEQEANAAKVERRLRKSAAALLMMPRRGEVFDGIVTGASEKGTWVRTLRPPVEGKLLVRGWSSVDVGDRVRVKLVDLDVRQGFIDFVLA